MRKLKWGTKRPLHQGHEPYFIIAIATNIKFTIWELYLPIHLSPLWMSALNIYLKSFKMATPNLFSQGHSLTSRENWDWGRPHIHICPILPSSLKNNKYNNTRCKNTKIQQYKDIKIQKYMTRRIWAGSICFTMRVPPLSYQSKPPNLPSLPQIEKK